MAAPANDVILPLGSGRTVHTRPAHAPAMSLDKNLFTLQFTPSPDDPDVIDLVDPSGVVHYRKHRVQSATYQINVYGKTFHPHPISVLGLFLSLGHYRPDIRIIVDLRRRHESSKPTQDSRTFQSVNRRGAQGRRKGFVPVVV